ncbi:hypothetical protein [Roseomonas harenae]|uniref:hypothetical protein n=1 Tax=Muricoccus harenae TaxID=2692566 RepID=UPI00133162FC|nr:hypothetical protein [Roseomonas harenae]
MRWLLLLALIAASPALAHEGHHHAEPGFDIELDPVVVVPLLVSAVLYGRGVARLWGRAGIGRGVAVRQAACFALALQLRVTFEVGLLGDSLMCSSPE